MNKIKGKEDNKIHFESFAPVDNAALGTYENAIDDALNDNTIKNIAIIGPYSSGKSSILQTYLKKKKIKKGLIRISLAHFNSSGDKDYNAPQSQNTLEEDKYPVEGKIINQLIQQVTPRKMPLSIFKRKHSSIASTIIWSATIFLLITCGISFAFWSEIEAFKNKTSISMLKMLSDKNLDYIFMANVICFLFSLFVLIYKITCLIKRNNSIHKLKVSGAEVELFPNNDGHTVFDKYLDEIIYLLRRSKAKYIIFEDIDRFESVKLFERLREINTILNIGYKPKKQKKPVKFIYLVKDSLLTAKDRTKFFDIIIPVIPVVDSTNSYSKFINYLKEHKLEDKLNKQFLSELFLYVDDLRIMKNVINEMMIYSNQIDMENLDYNKLLALLTYKSLFPKDFSELQFNNGYIYQLFSSKDILIRDKKIQLEKVVQELKPRLEITKNEPFDSILQVAIYFLIKKNIHIQNLDPDYVIQTVSRTLSVKDKEIFDSWCKVVEDKNKNIESIYYNTENNLAKLESTPLHILLLDKDVDSYFNNIESTDYTGKTINTYSDIKTNEYYPLIKYLIRNDYIDETYPKYMTYFYEGGISLTDEMFLRSITDQKKKDYTYKLDNPKEVIKRLNRYSFDKEEVLNFDIVSELVEGYSNSHLYKDYMDAILLQINKSKNWIFLVDYINYCKEKEHIIKIINANIPAFFSHIVTNAQPAFLHTYCIYSINTCINTEIRKININNCLTNYISENKTFLSIEKPQADKIIKSLNLLNVKFKQIDEGASNRDLLQQVYNDSLYELNSANTLLMMRNFINTNRDIIHSNLTVIYENQETVLGKYAIGNINNYIDVALSICDDSINDTNETITWVLNKTEIEIEKRKRYIHLLDTNLITDTSMISDNTLQDEIFNQDKAACNETTIVDYFSRRKFNDILIGYLNRNDLSGLKFMDNPENVILPALLESIIFSNQIKIEQYKILIMSFTQIIIALSSKLESVYLEALISNRKIKMNSDTLSSIRTHYKNYLFDFILSDFDGYIKIGNIPQDEAEIILLSSKFTNEQKLQVLAQGTEYHISIIGKSYPQDIHDYIIANCPDPADFEDMFSQYSEYPESAQPHILKQAKTLLISGNLAKYYEKINHALIIDLLKEKGITEQIRTDLCKTMINMGKDKDFILTCLLLFDEKYKTIFSPDGRIYLPVSQTNTLLLEALKAKQLIKNYQKNKTGTKYSIRKTAKL